LRMRTALVKIGLVTPSYRCWLVSQGLSSKEAAIAAFSKSPSAYSLYPGLLGSRALR